MRVLIRRPAALSLWLLLAFIAACAGGPNAVEYYRDETTMRLDTFPQAAVTYGTGLNQWTYDHKDVSVRLRLDVEREFNFELKLTNNGTQPLTIDWAHAYYINGAGYRYHLAHQGVPYWSPVSKLRPTTVAPGQTIQDALQPAREAKRDGVWVLAPLTDPQISQGDWPNQLTILMPMTVGGVTTVHRFDMDIDALDPVDGWGGPWYY
jgi:hypothetical protein